METALTKNEKWKAITELGKKLDKKFESTTFHRQGERVQQKIPSIPMKLPSLDRKVLGCGGVPRGRIIEIFGQESSGKTALCLHLIGECQKAGGVAAFIDAEHGLDATFANTLGVNMDELVISQPDCGEEALEIVEGLVEASAVDLIVVDSVAALVPRAEAEGAMGDSHMGLQARLMSQACRKLCGIVSKKDVTVIFINQVRENIGVMFGNPEVTTGGRALKFYSSIRLEIRRVALSKGGLLKDAEGNIIGHKMGVKNVKNKCAIPLKRSEVDLYYEAGFDTTDDAVNFAIEIGAIVGGAWLIFKNDKNGEKFRRDDLDINRVLNAIDEHFTELEKVAQLKLKTSEDV